MLSPLIEEALRGHREAIMAGDPAAIARWTEELSRLLPVLNALAGQAGAPGGALPSAARQLREAVRMNLTLAQNGLIIAHQFAASVAEASSADDPALFALALLVPAMLVRGFEADARVLGAAWAGALVVEGLVVFAVRRASARLATAGVFFALGVLPLSWVVKEGLASRQRHREWHCVQHASVTPR